MPLTEKRKTEIILRFTAASFADSDDFDSTKKSREEIESKVAKQLQDNPSIQAELCHQVGATLDELVETFLWIIYSPEFKPNPPLEATLMATEATGPDNDPSGKAVPQECLGTTPDPVGSIVLPEEPGQNEWPTTAPLDGRR